MNDNHDRVERFYQLPKQLPTGFCFAYAGFLCAFLTASPALTALTMQNCGYLLPFLFKEKEFCT
jgi:hypothetical protein